MTNRHQINGRSPEHCRNNDGVAFFAGTLTSGHAQCNPAGGLARWNQGTDVIAVPFADCAASASIGTIKPLFAYRQ
jgi:hypothetical protein